MLDDFGKKVIAVALITILDIWYSIWYTQTICFLLLNGYIFTTNCDFDDE